MAFNDFLGIPADCDTAVLFSALPADPNCVLPPGLAQVNYLFISFCTAVDPFVNDGSDVITLVANEIDNTNADNTKTRQLLGEGGIPEHEVTEVPGPNRSILIPAGGRKFEINHRILITDNDMRNFLRKFQGGKLNFRFWYQDLSGWLYGPVLPTLSTTYGGIFPSFVNVQMPKGEGPDDYNYATLTIRWDADADAPAYISPVSVSSTCVPA